MGTASMIPIPLVPRPSSQHPAHAGKLLVWPPCSTVRVTMASFSHCTQRTGPSVNAPPYLRYPSHRGGPEEVSFGEAGFGFLLLMAVAVVCPHLTGQWTFCVARNTPDTANP